jgi:hypothetical protein
LLDDLEPRVVEIGEGSPSAVEVVEYAELEIRQGAPHPRSAAAHGRNLDF